MNKLKLEITDNAKEDILKITEYISKYNKKAARDISEYFYKVCSALTEFPQIRTVRTDFTYDNLRFFVIKRHYIIAYSVTQNCIIIVRVLSNYQDICALL